MRPVVVSTSDASGAVKRSNPVPVDHYKTPFNIGIGCVVNGTVNYDIEHSFDDPFAAGYTAAGATWFNHATLVAQTASADGNYAFPVRAVRLVQNSGSGSVVATIIQAGR